jgi:hypothetical protein
MDTMTHAPIRKGDEAPAVLADEWLPRVDLFTELTELVQEMDRLKAQRATASAHTRSCSEALENHEQQRDAELRNAYATGEPDRVIPDERDKLKAALEDAQAHANAAVGALLDHINHCIATVVEKRREWIGLLDERERVADEEDAALVAQLMELRKNRANFSALEYWLERTGGPVRAPGPDRPAITAWGAAEPMAHFPYGSIARPLSSSPEIAEREKRAIFMESYRTHGDVVISDEQSEAREAAAQLPGEVSGAAVLDAERQLRGALAGEPGAI